MHPRQNDNLAFQIGLDRCGTTSLFMLFEESGYPSAHFLCRGSSVYGTMLDGILSGDGPISKFPEDLVFFSDIKAFVKRNAYSEIKDGSRWCYLFEKWYPNAKFILNTRPKEKWIKSKLGYGIHRTKKEQIELLSKGHGMTPDEYMHFLGRYWDEHYALARQYFIGDIAHKMIEFNIENDNIEKLIDFMRPEFNLNPSFWKQHNASGA